MTTPTPLPDNRPLCVVTGHPCGSDTVRVGTDCPSTSGRCVHKSQSSFTQQNMTTPTPMECEHGQLARSCNICELERDLAAAKDTISKYHERIISQHAQIDDLKWSLWKIEGKHKAAMLEVITKLAAAQEEIAAWKYRAQVYCDEGNGQRERAQAAEARAEEYKKDAERYRYLRSRDKDEVFNNDGVKAGVWIDCTAEDGTLQLLTFEDADAAIDAVFAGEPK